MPSEPATANDCGRRGSSSAPTSAAGVAATGPNDVISCETGAADVVRTAGASSVSAAATPMRLPSSSIGSTADETQAAEPLRGEHRARTGQAVGGQVLRRAAAPGEHAIRAARAGGDVGGRRDALGAVVLDEIHQAREQRRELIALGAGALNEGAFARDPCGERLDLARARGHRAADVCFEMPAGRFVARAETHELPADADGSQQERDRQGRDEESPWGTLHQKPRVSASGGASP